MRIATRLSIAVHILALLETEPDPGPTSERIAGSVGANPVVVRNVAGMLKAAGLVSSSQGVPGFHLVRPLDGVSLLDVYRAVEEDGELFATHSSPNPECHVGRNIQAVLDDTFVEAQRAMEERLGVTTVGSLVEKIRQLS